MKTSLIVTVVFFFVFHTQEYWSEYLSIYYLFVLVALFGAFLFVVGSFFSELYHSIREKFTKTQRTISLIITTIVIALTIYAPFGFVKYNWFMAEDILVANREGAANCMTNLYLKKDGTFLESSFCFGAEHRTGVFLKKNDTIWFASKHNFYEFGTIDTKQQDNGHGYLYLYKSKQDTPPYFMMLPE